eukprot:g130.t1
MTALDNVRTAEPERKASWASIRRFLRKRFDVGFTRFKDVDNSLREHQRLRVSFSRDLKFIRFHSMGNVCCVPFTHMRGACFGTKTVELGDADETRTISLYFLTMKTVYLQTPSKRDAMDFLEAIFWLKFGYDPQPVTDEELRRAVEHDHIYVYQESPRRTSETNAA